MENNPKPDIVVVDGEPVVRSVVAKILERAGYVVHATPSIDDALHVCKITQPGLVLTNVLLPGITGHEAMKLLRSQCPGTPVLMMSGVPDSDVIQQWALEKGFDVFPKPFHPDELLAKVESVMKEFSAGADQ